MNHAHHLANSVVYCSSADSPRSLRMPPTSRKRPTQCSVICVPHYARPPRLASLPPFASPPTVMIRNLPTFATPCDCREHSASSARQRRNSWGALSVLVMLVAGALLLWSGQLPDALHATSFAWLYRRRLCYGATRRPGTEMTLKLGALPSEWKLSLRRRLPRKHCTAVRDSTNWRRASYSTRARVFSLRRSRSAEHSRDSIEQAARRQPPYPARAAG